jgi:putative ABC transport system permease protein
MIFQALRIALRSLKVNKLRTALTMLGIMIGVGAVIAMVSVGTGAQARVAEQIQSRFRAAGIPPAFASVRAVR